MQRAMGVRRCGGDRFWSRRLLLCGLLGGCDVLLGIVDISSPFLRWFEASEVDCESTNDFLMRMIVLGSDSALRSTGVHTLLLRV